MTVDKLFHLRKVNKLAWMFLLWLVATPSTAISAAIEASFPCNQAQTDIDRLICSDAGLAAKDREMSRLWKQVYKLYPRFLVNQRHWLKERDEDLEKLADQYQDRNEQLKQYLNPISKVIPDELLAEHWYGYFGKAKEARLGQGVAVTNCQGKTCLLEYSVNNFHSCYTRGYLNIIDAHAAQVVGSNEGESRYKDGCYMDVALVDDVLWIGSLSASCSEDCGARIGKLSLAKFKKSGSPDIFQRHSKELLAQAAHFLTQDEQQLLDQRGKTCASLKNLETKYDCNFAQLNILKAIIEGHNLIAETSRERSWDADKIFFKQNFAKHFHDGVYNNSSLPKPIGEFLDNLVDQPPGIFPQEYMGQFWDLYQPDNKGQTPSETLVRTVSYKGSAWDACANSLVHWDQGRDYWLVRIKRDQVQVLGTKPRIPLPSDVSALVKDLSSCYKLQPPDKTADEPLPPITGDKITGKGCFGDEATRMIRLAQQIRSDKIRDFADQLDLAATNCRHNGQAFN